MGRNQYLRALFGFCLICLGVVAPAFAESSVWKVTGPHATVYLAGSFHLLKPADYPLPPEFEQAYADSAKVYFEVLLDMPGQPDLTAQVMKYAVYSDGTGLKDHLSPETYNHLAEFCRSQNLDVETFDRYRPWMVETVLTLGQMQKSGYDPDLGVDRHFMVQAQRDGKPVAALETVEEQIRWLASLDDGANSEQVEQTIRELSQSEAASDQMAQAWRAGDLDTLAGLLNAEMTSNPGLRKLLLDDRNHRWIQTIERDLAGTENVLFVVGAGHFAGEEGLLALLQKDGFAVEKL